MGLTIGDVAPQRGRRGCVLFLPKEQVGNEFSTEFSEMIEARSEAATECLLGRNHQRRERACFGKMSQLLCVK